MRLYRCSKCGQVFCFTEDKVGMTHFCGDNSSILSGTLEPISITVSNHAYEYSEAGGEVTGIDVVSTVSINVEEG